MKFIRKLASFSLLLCLWLTAFSVFASRASLPNEKVSLQLKWLHAFQFAGYYAAKEKGFYAEEGLDVEIRQRIPKVNNIEQVISGEANYGVADSNLLLERFKGKPVVILASIFQHNPLVYFTLKSSGILGAAELKGKRVMDDEFDRSPLMAMLQEANVSMNDLQHLDNSFNPDDLITGKTDATVGYLTDQLDYYRSKNVEVNIIDPRNYGIDFLGDNLFTTEQEINTNPERVNKFIRASLKGWEYAVKNPEEIIELILKKYNPDNHLTAEHLRFEANETIKMISPNVVPIGTTSPQRFQRMAEIYQQFGLIDSTEGLTNFLYQPVQKLKNLTEEENHWLQAHPVLKLGAVPVWEPISMRDKNGQLSGITGDYRQLIEAKLGLRLELETEKPWMEVLDEAKSQQIDILMLLAETPEKSKYLNFSDAILELSYVIVTRKENVELNNFDKLAGRRVSVVQGTAVQEWLLKTHPELILISKETITQALETVSSKEVDAYIGNMVTARPFVNNAMGQLKIAGNAEFTSQLRIGVRKDLQEFIPILNKAIASIDATERNEIWKKWVVSKSEGIAPKLFYSILVFGVVLIVVILFISNRKLRKAHRLMERKVKERTAELFEQRNRLQAILDNAGDGIHILDKNLGVVQFSNRFATMLGYMPEEILQLKVPDWDVAILPQDLEQITAKALIEPLTFETLHRRKDGSIFNVEIMAKGIELSNEIYFYASSRDITERKVLEEKLKNSEAKFRSIIDLSPIPIALNDNDKNVIFINETFVQTFGYDLSDIPTLSEWWQKAYPDPNYRQWVIKTWNETLQKARLECHAFVPMEIVVVCKDGSKKIVIASATVTKEISDFHLVMLHDITDRKRNELLMLEAQKAAESLAKSKSEFLANMSHEIRTPMNGIIGLTKLALNQQMSSDLRSYLEKISQSSESLLGILNQILDLSKLEAGKFTIDCQRFNLDEMLGNLQNLFESHATEKSLSFVINVTDNTPTDLIGDALRLQQILSNLIGNAIKFTEHGGIKIEVSPLEKENSQARIRFVVSDTGIGITEEDQRKLFQPFSQVDASATRRFGGTGLGLVISKNLLELMGSELKLESAINHGTTFSFDLLVQLASEQLHHFIEQHHKIMHAQAGALEQDLHERALAMEGARILVAEDNVINQQVVKEFLKLSGMIVDVANNGKEALQLLEHQIYDAVLMDIHMPEIDGVEATKQIRHHLKLDKLPIIALTAGVTSSEREICSQSGMNDFLPKPVNPEQLVITLGKWIKKMDSSDQIISAQPTQKDRWSEIEMLLPDFDFYYLKMLIGGNAGLLESMLKEYFTENKNFPTLLFELLKENKILEAQVKLHNFKGVSGSVGAVELHRVCNLLDLQLKQGAYTEEMLNEWREQFEKTFVALDTLHN